MKRARETKGTSYEKKKGKNYCRGLFLYIIFFVVPLFFFRILVGEIDSFGVERISVSASSKIERASDGNRGDYARAHETPCAPVRRPSGRKKCPSRPDSERPSGERAPRRALLCWNWARA